MNSTISPASERTEEAILQIALELFRSRGFDVTTMRDIARAAKVATGAAYYYFPSKEAIVSAYYDQVQCVHAEKAREEHRHLPRGHHGNGTQRGDAPASSRRSVAGASGDDPLLYL
jgi:AcrR family transcriptional regulator